MEEVDPSFVMATLICFLGTQPAERDSEASMRADVPFILGTRRFSEPHTSDHSPGTPPGHQNGEGPGGTGKFVLTNASSMMLTCRGSLFDWRRHATIEVTSHHVNLLLVHYSTDCKQQVLCDSVFLSICAVNVERHHV